MNKLAGVRADKKYSHQKLEGVAGHVRKALEFGSDVGLHLNAGNLLFDVVYCT